jgi:S-adenosylmethionine:tRNA ribosyltransferase-isomerase
MVAALERLPLDFSVPPELEAREPAESRGLERDDVRLLVSDRAGGALAHARFRELAGFLRRGDLLVINDSATLPAALEAWAERNGREIALHLSTHVAGTLWTAEPRGDVEATEVLHLPGDGRATLLAPVDARSRRLWYTRLEVAEPVVEYLSAYGHPIRYPYMAREFPIARYQTIFARSPGSAEMPSAGRPFSPRVLEALQRAGVEIATLTLHAGVASQESHEPPFAEAYAVPQRTALRVNAARRAGRRVIAVGTTVVRALESAAPDGEVIASQGWTDLVVTPQRGVAVVDGLLTGLHEPQASHIAMLGAFLDERSLSSAYRAALEGGYLWHEFGDVHLIAPRTLPSAGLGQVSAGCSI